MQTIAASSMPARKPAKEASPTPFAQRVKQAREARGMSMRKLADAAKVSHTAVSLLEAGRQEAVELTAAVALARALGVTVEWLVTGDGDAPKAPNA